MYAEDTLLAGEDRVSCSEEYYILGKVYFIDKEYFRGERGVMECLSQEEVRILYAWNACVRQYYVSIG